MDKCWVFGTLTSRNWEKLCFWNRWHSYSEFGEGSEQFGNRHECSMPAREVLASKGLSIILAYVPVTFIPELRAVLVVTYDLDTSGSTIKIHERGYPWTWKLWLVKNAVVWLGFQVYFLHCITCLQLLFQPHILTR